MMTDVLERLREQAWRRSGAPKMDAGHTKMLEWEAADEIERLEKECFALAANQCHDGIAGEHGDHVCREIERLRAKNRELASAIATRLLDKDTKELRDEIDRLRIMYNDCIKDLREASE
jgi:archaellum component FlaC